MDIYSRVICAVVYLWIIILSKSLTAQDESRNGAIGADPLLKRLLELHSSNKLLIDHAPRPYYVTTPVQLRNNEIVAISTREPRTRHAPSQNHYKRVTFLVQIGTRKLELSLTLNEVILSSGITIKHFLKHNQQLLSSGVENCYYQGRVVTDQWSAVSVSTCHGIRGIIQLQNETYVIQPLIGGDEKKNHPHVIYKEPPPDKAQCGNKHGLWLPYSQLHKGEYVRRLKYLKSRQIDNEAPQPRKRLHLALVFDSTFQSALNLSHSHMITYAIQTANALNTFYATLQTDIVLVYAEIWDSVDHFPVSSALRRTLYHFLRYKLDTLARVPHTVAQFLTTTQFEGNSFGMSVPDSICTSRAVGVSTTPSAFEPQKMMFSLAHMLAHNLGISHDDNAKARAYFYEGKCDCPHGDAACIMTNRIQKSSDAIGRVFSSCSQASLDVAVRTGLASCLLTDGQVTFSQTCGNNHVERGEECDCGSPEECALSNPCCDPELCVLKSWATCHQGPCCHNCTLLPPSHVCRPKSTECDVPEFCDGQNGQCPQNDYIHDGFPCYNGTGYCYGGICPTLDQQCRAIWGQDARRGNRGCFEQFNPTGNFNGHCGRDPITGHFIKCLNADVMCGLLHCEGGGASPLFGPDNAFSKTTMSFGDLQYECKIVHGPTALDMPHMGLVQDGSQCDDDSVCMDRRCVPSTERDLAKCRAKSTAIVVCSGRGICTNFRRCFCDPGWAGRFCSQKITPATRPVSSTYYTYQTSRPLNTSLFVGHDHSDMMAALAPYITPAPTYPATAARRPHLSTTWLVIILVAVVLCLFLIFAIFMICCRRRSSPMKLKKSGSKSSIYSNLSINQKKAPVSLAKKLPSAKKSIKLLKFGALPVYKPSNLKLKKKIPSSGEESDHGDQTRPPIIVVSPNSAKPPERGILKNSIVTPERYMVRGGDTYANLDEFMPTSQLLTRGGDAPPYDYEEDVDAELQKIVDDCDEDCCSCSDAEFLDDEANVAGTNEGSSGGRQLPNSRSFDFVLPAPPTLGSPGCRESVSDREYSTLSNAKLAGGIVDYSLTPDSAAAAAALSRSYNVERGREMISSPKTERQQSEGRARPAYESPKADREDIDLSPSPEQRVVSYEQEIASPNPNSSVAYENHAVRNLPFVECKNSPSFGAAASYDAFAPNSPILRASSSPANSGSWKAASRRDAADDDEDSVNCAPESMSSYGCEKSSGYGSEHDGAAPSAAESSSSFHRPRFYARDNKSEPKYSSVIRTGPNRIELIPAEAPSSCPKANRLAVNLPPPVGDAQEPPGTGHVPCVDRSLEEIPHSASTSSDVGRGSSQSGRPNSLNLIGRADSIKSPGGYAPTEVHL